MWKLVARWKGANPVRLIVGMSKGHPAYCARYFGAIALTCMSCTTPAQCGDPLPKRPNVLFLLSDDQRPDTIAALGNRFIDTPHLDVLAQSGTVFRRAVSPNPVCVTSRGEILSGCTGFRNGVFGNSSRLNPDLVPWPKAMRDGGYRTWYVGKWHLTGRPTDHGFDETRGLFVGSGAEFARDERDWKGRPVTGYRGWIFEDDAGKKYPERGVGLTADISATFAAAAIEFLRRKHDKPFFLHVSFTAPHDPLIMPPGFDGKYDAAKLPLPPNFLERHPFDHGNANGRDELLLPTPRTPQDVREELAYYYAVISHMDAQIGRVLRTLEETGLAENTLVIFSADQGVAIGSHGLRGKQNMYEHTVGVPLILRGPGIPKGAVRRAQVYLRDLYPTVCELCGVAIPPTVEARSFAPVLSGKSDVHHPTIYGYFRDVQRMIREDRWKLIVYPQAKRRQLFDLVNDPHEINDLSGAPEQAELVGRLQNEMLLWMQSAGDGLAKRSDLSAQRFD